MEYEQVVDRVLREHPTARLLCRYDRPRFDDAAVTQMHAVHDTELVGAAVYDDNLLRITRSGPSTARLAGEVRADLLDGREVGEHVAHGDRSLRGHRLVDRTGRVDEHAAVGQLGQQVVHLVIELEPPLLHEHQRRHRGDHRPCRGRH